MNLKYETDTNKPEFEFMTVHDNLDVLTTGQKEIWDHFYAGKEKIGPLDKDDIDPIKIAKYLSCVWMADLYLDDEGKLKDYKYRLIGTRLTPIYGERTGEKIISDDGPLSLKNQMPAAYYRITNVLSLLAETNMPVFSRSYYTERARQHLNVSGITIPVCHDSDDVNMIFGFVDLSRTVV
ncbi:hypothetical protein [Pseudemcibacter aquimaris]|uniref:hypothetical protein n=1 Tax=Pseudemcibacter aquimaris TaxID=2857064 RepID=UPI002011A55D|nr:hypothetical protein [Pseudemcibacter aquimaris]MCC3859895.1 hypothetical protein [Pseudemcibacter aquimaris]WDU57227.1 hypothetical protein KW060_08455 [Pseudemcibacter aquimaris]